MAGLIELNEDSWSVATWVFNHVLRLTRPHLPDEGSSRILELIGEADEGREYLPLQKLSLSERKIFRTAAEQAYREIEAEGSSSFADPEFFPPFMDRFRELLEMLRKEE